MNWLKSQMKVRYDVVFWAWMFTYIASTLVRFYAFTIEGNWDAAWIQMFATIWLSMLLFVSWNLKKVLRSYRALVDELIDANEKSNNS